MVLLYTIELQRFEHRFDHGSDFLDRGSSSHRGFIKAPCQQANEYTCNIVTYFRDLLQIKVYTRRC